ncbi:MAG TPA: DUF177 domain-containing protein [Allosphingosinicella sp.]|jgi:uncharacterized metal-binding protein YceD (DUF177 family)|uniref:YceD family protein n=1 Tax=Allosphingosinicella sp. TaxID=2823234 RepID=UPI002F295EB7
MNPPEFSRPVRIDTLGPGPRAISIGANEGERAALARRFDLQGIEHLSAKAELSLSGEVVRASGTLVASVTQSCVATGAPVPAELEEEFRIEFRPEPTDGRAEEEIELSGSELDVIFYDGASVDLGEAVAETLSLALDPYPRCPAADTALAEVGVVKEGDEPPSGPLAGLKDLLSR